VLAGITLHDLLTHILTYPMAFQNYFKSAGLISSILTSPSIPGAVINLANT
jgi:hypothetical protein